MSQPANATELLGLANEKFCITGEWGYTVRELPKRPWKWNQRPRVAIAKRQISMSRGEVLAACFTKEKKTMLSVTGTAEFSENGKRLETKTVIQPHFPLEHDQLERVAKLCADGGVTMEQGQLVMRRTLIIPSPVEAVRENTSVEYAGEGEPLKPEGEQEKAPVKVGDLV